MEIEIIKKYLKNYLENVINPRFTKTKNKDNIESLELYDVQMDSNNRIRVFIDTNPVVNNPFTSTIIKLEEVKDDVENFLRMLSVMNPVVHYNQRPLF